MSIYTINNPLYNIEREIELVQEDIEENENGINGILQAHNCDVRLSVVVCRYKSICQNCPFGRDELQRLCCLQTIHWFLAYGPFCLFFTVILFFSINMFHRFLRTLRPLTMHETLIESVISMDIFYLLIFCVSICLCGRRKGKDDCCLNWKSFWLIFSLSFVG